MFVVYIVKFKFQYLITKDVKGNEGICIGVSSYPVSDENYQTTQDMWLYRGYSGNLYHGKELPLVFPSFTQGDFITCLLNTNAGTLSFSKNGGPLKVAFEGVFSSGLYPCVLFYSLTPGEKVRYLS